MALRSEDFQALERALTRLTRTVERSGGGAAAGGGGLLPAGVPGGGLGAAGRGGAGAAPGGFGTGFRQGLGINRIASRFAGLGASGVAGSLAGGGLLAAGAGALAVGGSALAGGLINAQRGGTFAAGAGAGVTDLLAKVPVFGELSGAAPASRIRSGTISDLNGLTNQVARYAGPNAISPKVRSFLAQLKTKEQENIEQDRQRNQAAATDAGAGTRKDVALGLVGTLERLASALEKFVGGAGGGIRS